MSEEIDKASLLLAKANVYEDIYEEKRRKSGLIVDKIRNNKNKLEDKLKKAIEEHNKRVDIYHKEMRVAQHPIFEEYHKVIKSLSDGDKQN